MMTAADQRLQLQQQKIVLLQQLLQVATTTMMMTVAFWDTYSSRSKIRISKR
jgi:hypothetical protein